MTDFEKYPAKGTSRARRAAEVALTTTPLGQGFGARGDLVFRAARVRGGADAAVALARLLGIRSPRPGRGETARRWELLATVAAADLTAARVAEAHIDALAILAEAEIDPEADLAAIGAGRDSTWGVFAAEAPGAVLRAEEIQLYGAGRWHLAGTKPWCSLAGNLSHALVTAHTPGGHRRLFALDLKGPNVKVETTGWESLGLREVVSGPIELQGAEAIPVGADEWYLERPGFAWGGAGVAACWYGGAVGLARTLHAAAARKKDQIGQMHLGAVDLALAGARAVLGAAADDIDAGRADADAGVIMAARVRGVVAAAAEEVLRRVGHALGPAPLAHDAEHARRVADLQIYVRQHHAERDDAALGADLASGPAPW